MHINYRDISYPVVLLVFVFFLLSSTAVCASQLADTSITEGIAAFRAGQYQQAVDLITDAIKEGANGPAVYYNLGVANYKLKNYADADAAFLKVAEDPKWEALAQYNRALIAYRQKQPEIARELAALSIRLTDDPKLTALNFFLLHRMDRKIQNASAWPAFLQFGAGYNDNVLLTDAGASAISGKSDTFVDVVGRAKHIVSLKSSNQLTFLAQAYLRDYSRLNNYDQLSIRVGMEKELGKPEHGVGFFIDHVSLGGSDFDLASSLEYQQPLSSNSENPIRLNYGFTNYSMLNNSYDYLGGVRHQLKLSKAFQFSKSSLESWIRVEYNDRVDQTSGTDFYSYSPIGIGIGARYNRNLASNNSISGSVFGQASRFQDPEIRGGVVGQTREDSLLEMRLQFLHVSTSKWIYRANYIQTVNDSNYSEFAYKQAIVSFEMLRFF